MVKGIALADYASYLDERATFLGQWGLKGARGDGPSYDELVETEGRPRLRMWLDRIKTENLLEAAVVYGYFPCYSEGNDVVVLHERGPAEGQERARFTFPRQRRDRRLCLADFFRSKDATSRTAGPTSSPSSWSRWAPRSPRRPPSCSRPTPTATTSSCTACRCS